MKRLFSRFLMAAIAAILLCGGTAARATTLTGTLNNPDGSPFNGTIFLTLSQAGTISSTGTCGGPIYVPNTFQVSIQVVAGAIVSSPSIYDSMCFATPGIPYSVQLVSSTGAVVAQTWVITSSPLQTGSENVGTIIPISISGVVFQLPAAANVTSFLFGGTSVPLSSTAPSGSTNYLCNVSGQIVGCSGGAGGMTWPAGGAGIPNYTGGSAYSTTYNASNLIPANFLPKATGSTFGIIEPDGSSCTVTSGVLSCSGSGALPINNPTFTGAMNGPTMTVGSTVQLAPLNAVGNGTTDDTTALQTAITNNRYLVLASGKTYLISSALTIPCGVSTTIDFNGSTITLANAANSNMLQANCANGDGTHIRLIHGILQGNGGNQTPNYTSPIWGSGYFGLIGEFTRIDYLYMQDWQIINSTTWGIGLTLCGDTVFKDMYFNTPRDITNVGGIQGSAKNIYIDHVWGYQPDDIIGISSGEERVNNNDVGVTVGENIDINNIVIRNVSLGPNAADTLNAVGIGIYPMNGHTFHNVDISNVTGAYSNHVIRMYDYWATGQDYIGSVRLSNINATVGTPGSIASTLNLSNTVTVQNLYATGVSGSLTRPGMTTIPPALAEQIPLYSAKFTAPSGTALTSFQSGTSAGTFSAVNGSWTISATNYLQQSTTITTGACQGCATYATGAAANVLTMTAQMIATNTTYAGGIVFRYEDSGDFFLAQWNNAGIAIYQATGGTLTQVANTPIPIVTSTPYTLVVTDNANVITATAGGASVSYASTALNTFVTVGLMSPDPSVHIYNFSVYDYDAVVNPPLANVYNGVSNTFTQSQTINSSNTGGSNILLQNTTAPSGSAIFLLLNGSAAPYGASGSGELLYHLGSTYYPEMNFLSNLITAQLPVTMNGGILRIAPPSGNAAYIQPSDDLSSTGEIGGSNHANTANQWWIYDDGSAKFGALSVPSVNGALLLRGTTGTITGTALSATCDSGTATVTGAVVGHPVSVSSTTGVDVGAAFYLRGSVTATNTVTVYVCGTGTPSSLAYNVVVF